MPPGSLAAAHGVSEGRLEAHANAQVEVEDQLVDLALVLIADHLALALRIDPKVGLTGSDLAIVDACADGRLDRGCWLRSVGGGWGWRRRSRGRSGCAGDREGERAVVGVAVIARDVVPQHHVLTRSDVLHLHAGVVALGEVDRGWSGHDVGAATAGNGELD